MWQKIMKEVKLGRFAEPYLTVPYHKYVQLPIGLVPNANNQTRLIVHLSYDFQSNKSINYWTPKHLASVKYNDLDHAVRNCLINHTNSTAKLGVFLARTDFQSAFRVLPLSPSVWRWLIIKAHHPLTNKTYFFVNKNLPFGHRILV